MESDDPIWTDSFVCGMVGTAIEQWMSTDAMAACPNHTQPQKASLLWNAMVSPFTPMVTAGFLWWQGESNALTVANAHEYSCNQKALTQDLRRKFSATPQLPFIFVQSFPLFGDLSRFQPYPGLPSTPANTMQGLSELRLSQAESCLLYTSPSPRDRG